MGNLSSPDKRIRGSKGVKLRKRRLARSNYLCEHCRGKGRVSIATVVNHKVPLAHGGEDTDENTENLCTECDEIETARLFGTKVKQAMGADGWPIERG